MARVVIPGIEKYKRISAKLRKGEHVCFENQIEEIAIKYTIPGIIAKFKGGLLLLLVLFFVTSCAPVGMSQQVYGFLYGIVHGFISPFVLIAKLFGAHIGLYAEHNNGSLYWVGFVLGLVLLFGGGGGSYTTRKRWYDH